MNASYLDNFKNVVRGDCFISPTLLEFASSILKKYPSHSLIEFGCDQGDLLSKLDASQKIGIDLSPSAISLAKSKFPDLEFHVHNALVPLEQKADILLDSHLYHCLVFKEERLSYLKNLKNSLNTKGKVLIECLGEPVEKNWLHLLHNESGQIWAETMNQNLHGLVQMNQRFFLPFRTFFTHDSEAEIKLSGLRIESLFYSPLEFEFTIMGEKLIAPLVRLTLGH
ncbi:MAG: class I SAM-dependent methyltransferase [Bacteriovoracaceae bacterium]